MSSNANRGLVLVVDDADGTRWMVERLLENEGYESRSVTNGAEALEYLSNFPSPIVIVLDLSMPVMTGWEFLECQRVRPQFADIPVVLYSGELAVSKKRWEGTNVVAFVPKDAAPKQLLSAVGQAAALKKAVGA